MNTANHRGARGRSRAVCSAFVLLAIVGVSFAARAAIPDLIISEYVEGSSSNKAIEIYNGTGASVNLSGYTLELYSNGNTTASSTWAPTSGTLAPGATWVLVNGNAGATLAAYANDTSSVTNFNGDDALVLKHNGTVIDSLGQVGTDPGSYWGTGSLTTKDHTLRRKSTVCLGDTTDNDAFDPATEWDGFAKDTFDGLGAHTVSCNPNAIIATLADAAAPEGDSGTTNLDFTLQFSKPAPAGGVSFDITVTGVDATAGTDFDLPANASSVAAGATTATISIPIHGDTAPEGNETFTVTLDNFSDSNVSPISLTATGTITNDDAIEASIPTIQGSPTTQDAEGASPLVGKLVHTSGIVTANDGAGFFIQAVPGDGDPLTSDGVYVYAPSLASGVAVGDAVNFKATVSEYKGLTELVSPGAFNIDSHGNALPAPIVFDAATPSPDPDALSCGNTGFATNFECFEGMRVSIANGMVTEGSGYSSAHTYDYLKVTANGKRSLREPGLFPGNASSVGDNDAVGHWDGNPELFELSPNEFAGVNNDQVPITGGSTFTATGIFSQSYGLYTLYPTTFTVTYAAPIPRPVADADPAILRIGEINVERYCDDVDDTVPPGTELTKCVGNGNTLPTPSEYDTKAQRIADYIGTVLDLPDVVALEEVENIGALTKLAGKLQTDYGVTYQPYLVEGNDIGGIDVGLLVNTARVQVFSVQQLDKDLKWHTPNNHDRPVFDRPPLLLQGVFTGAGSQPIMVMVNHLKARQAVDDVDSSGNPTADAREDQEKRFRQAYAVAKLVQNLQTTYSPLLQPFHQHLATTMATSTAMPLLVVGDFNAYEFTDGYADLVGMISGRYDFSKNLWDLSDLTKWNLQPIPTPLVDANIVVPPLWNAIWSLPENERYSYLFAPSLGKIQGYVFPGKPRKPATDQILDHALLNQAARADFVRMDYGRANQDAASEDEYNSTGAIGVSDHDGFVVQLTFDRIFADGFENRN